MANNFANNVKVKLLAAAIADNMDWTKAAVDKMPASEWKNKKYGKSYKIYLPTTPSVVDGIVANPDDVVEVETEIKLENKNSSVRLDAWNTLGDIEDFTKQIAVPLGNALARTEEKSIIKDNIFKAAQAFVVPKVSGASGAGFGMLGDASAALRSLAVSGDVVSFLNPQVAATISKSGLANFIPDEIQKEIYQRNYLGEYAGASQIISADLPTITTKGSAATGSLALTEIKDGQNNVIGYESAHAITGTNLVAGQLFTLSGLKVVDASGITTDQDYKIVVTSVNATGTAGEIFPIRIAVGDFKGNNPNAYVDTALTLSSGAIALTSALSTSTTYQICCVRTKDCFTFSTYDFADLPGSENEAVAVVGGHSVKMSMYGDGTNMVKLVRVDAPFAAGVMDNRGVVVLYVEK